MVSQQFDLKARNQDYTLGMQYVNDFPIELGHIVPDDNNRYLRIIWLLSIWSSRLYLENLSKFAEFSKF